MKTHLGCSRAAISRPPGGRALGARPDAPSPAAITDAPDSGAAAAASSPGTGWGLQMPHRNPGRGHGQPATAGADRSGDAAPERQGQPPASGLWRPVCKPEHPSCGSSPRKGPATLTTVTNPIAAQRSVFARSQVLTTTHRTHAWHMPTATTQVNRDSGSRPRRALAARVQWPIPRTRDATRQFDGLHSPDIGTTASEDPPNDTN